MNAPVLWVVVPGVAALLLYLARRWEQFVHITGIVVSLLMAGLAWQVPIDKPIELGLGLPALQLPDTFLILGRSFVITDASRPILILIYLAISLWFGGAYIAGVNRLFIPLGLGMGALFTAALAVEPQLYAFLLIQMAVLICIPILSAPGKIVQSGTLRFLSFQIIGMCFILTSDWLLARFRANPNDIAPILPATLLFGLGYALISGIFPFHTWIPMLAEQSHPYAAAFVFFLLPTAATLISLSYLEFYAGFQIYPTMLSSIRYAGVLMVLIGGVWAAFERHLGRILSFAVISQLGMSLIAIGLSSETTSNPQLKGIFFAQLIPQAVALAIWALAMSAIYARQPNLRFRNIQGIAHEMPISAASIVLANFSLAGLPLLASFPGNIALWSALSMLSLPAALFSLAGNASLFAAGLRTLAVLVMSPEAQEAAQEESARALALDETSGDSPPTKPIWSFKENGVQATLLLLGLVMLFIVGVTPQWLLPLMTRVALLFTGQGQ